MSVTATWLQARTAAELRELYPVPAQSGTCANCGRAVERQAGAPWVHEATGWTMCDVYGRMTAEVS